MHLKERWASGCCAHLASVVSRSGERGVKSSERGWGWRQLQKSQSSRVSNIRYLSDFSILYITDRAPVFFGSPTVVGGCHLGNSLNATTVKSSFKREAMLCPPHYVTDGRLRRVGFFSFRSVLWTPVLYSSTCTSSQSYSYYACRQH